MGNECQKCLQFSGDSNLSLIKLTMAGVQLKDADLYVILERCAPTRKTQSCTELIISSGIRRVFIVSIDPFPSVNWEKD